MGIEKDIQQAKFRNAHQKAGINLIYTLAWLNPYREFHLIAECSVSHNLNIRRLPVGFFPYPF